MGPFGVHIYGPGDGKVPGSSEISITVTVRDCKNLWLLMLTILMSSFKASALLEFEATFDQMTTLSKKLGLNTSPQADTGSRSLADPFAQFILQQANAILSNQNNAGTCPTSWKVHRLHIVAGSRFLAGDRAHHNSPYIPTKENVGLSSQM